MTTEMDLDEILAEIGREHRAAGAPERLEAVLCVATAGGKRAGRMPRARLAWTLAAVMVLLAAVAAAGVFWQARRVHSLNTQQAGRQTVPQLRHEPAPALTGVSGREEVPQRSARARSGGRDQARLRDSERKRAEWNSLDEFVPLPASEGLPSAAELSVVRMELRGSDLQQYGLEAPADAAAKTMLAEFVVGEDGLPRAIRIVR